MIYILITTALLSLLTGIIFEILSYKQYDLVLRKLYDDANELWISLAKPISRTFRPRKVSVFSMIPSLSGGYLFKLLVSSGYEDIEKIDGAKEILYKMKKFHRYSNIAGGVWCGHVATTFLYIVCSIFYSITSII